MKNFKQINQEDKLVKMEDTQYCKGKKFCFLLFVVCSWDGRYCIDAIGMCPLAIDAFQMM